MKNVRNLFIPLMLLLPALFLMNGCNEDITSPEETTVSPEELSYRTVEDMENEGDLGCGGCFSLVYPVTIEFQDGSQATVDSREAMRLAIKAYYEANPPARPRLAPRPQFVYPIDVMLEDGSVVTLESKEDLRTVLENCDFEPQRPNRPGFGSHGQFGGLNRCFNIVFPLTIDFPDGTSTTVDDREALKQALRDWKVNNPDATGRPVLAYPYDVELQDSTIVTIQNQDDRQDLREYCGGLIAEGHGPPCFTINYPVEIELPSGLTVTADDREEVLSTILLWLNANPSTDARPELVYPISVTYSEDGTVATVNSREEWRQRVEDCIN